MIDTHFSVGFSRDFLNSAGELAYGEIGLDLLEAAPHVRHRFLDEYHETITPEQIQDLEGLIVIFPWVKPETFASGAERLIVLARCGAGYDRIDLEACTKNDVAVVNAPRAMQLPTASASLMFMLALAKRLLDLDRIVRQGDWDERERLRGIELAGRTLGIIGLGYAGRELARLVQPFRMRVISYSPHADPDQAAHLGVLLVSLDTLLAESDFICLHCRLTEQTRGLIGAAELERMKPSAYLINMARGPVVDHAALVAALRQRRIAGAALDVFHEEPVPPDDPVTSLDNVILSPHWAAGTQDVFRNAGRSNCQAMLDAARGQIPRPVVNPEVLDRPGFRAKLDRFSGG